MTRFIEGEARTQATLFPEALDEYITEENSVRVIDVFVDGLDLANMGFKNTSTSGQFSETLLDGKSQNKCYANQQ